MACGWTSANVRERHMICSDRNTCSGRADAETFMKPAAEQCEPAPSISEGRIAFVQFGLYQIEWLQDLSTKPRVPSAFTAPTGQLPQSSVHMRALFADYSVCDVTIPINLRTNRAVGYAFVDLTTPLQAQTAIVSLPGWEHSQAVEVQRMGHKLFDKDLITLGALRGRIDIDTPEFDIGVPVRRLGIAGVEEEDILEVEIGATRRTLIFEEGGEVVFGDSAVGRTSWKRWEGVYSGSSSRYSVVGRASFQK